MVKEISLSRRMSCDKDLEKEKTLTWLGGEELEERALT